MTESEIDTVDALDALRGYNRDRKHYKCPSCGGDIAHGGLMEHARTCPRLRSDASQYRRGIKVNTPEQDAINVQLRGRK